MKTFTQFSKTFHKSLETDLTTIALIDFMDENSLGKYGVGIGMSPHIFQKLLLAIEEEHQIVHTPLVASRIFGYKFFSEGYKILKEGILRGYVIYSPQLKLIAVRGLSIPNTPDLFHEHFYTITPIKALEAEVSGIFADCLCGEEKEDLGEYIAEFFWKLVQLKSSKWGSLRELAFKFESPFKFVPLVRHSQPSFKCFFKNASIVPQTEHELTKGLIYDTDRLETIGIYRIYASETAEVLLFNQKE